MLDCYESSLLRWSYLNLISWENDLTKLVKVIIKADSYEDNVDIENDICKFEELLKNYEGHFSGYEIFNINCFTIV